MLIENNIFHTEEKKLLLNLIEILQITIYVNFFRLKTEIK